MAFGIVKNWFMDIKTLSSIRLIDYTKFRKLSSLPRYPDKKALVILASEIDYRNSFIIFVSHRWLRGRFIPPHPDNATNSKFKLLIRAIDFLWGIHAKKMKSCYIWLDFGCIDQDGNPAGELKMLDQIVGLADCLLTVIHDENPDWVMEQSTDGYLLDYKADGWKNGYLLSAWCRVEMLYASHVPLREDNDEDRINKFDAGVKASLQLGRRSHFLYGTKESNCGFCPELLYPLKESYLQLINPADGVLSFESDRVKIQELMYDLTKYLIKPEYGYFGSYNEFGLRHGKGVFKGTNGFYYKGDWANDIPHGNGTIIWMNGDKYVGEINNGEITGIGDAEFGFGGKQGGEWYKGKSHGKGYIIMSTGPSYVGDFVHGELTGKGDGLYSDGKITFRGYWTKGAMHLNMCTPWYMMKFCCRCCCSELRNSCLAFNPADGIENVNYRVATNYAVSLLCCDITGFAKSKTTDPDGGSFIKTSYLSDIRHSVNIVNMAVNNLLS